MENRYTDRDSYKRIVNIYYTVVHPHFNSLIVSSFVP